MGLANVLRSQEKESFNHGWEFINVVFEKNDTIRPDIGRRWADQFTNTKKGVDSSSYSDISLDVLPFEREIEVLKDAKWEATSLPHNALDKKFIIDNPKEGLTYYRKSFIIPEKDRGQQLSLEFEGAMQRAWVWVNGQFIKRHLGGYLPFTIDLTNIVRYGEINTITVKLDNRPHPLFPPGKPVLDLDFLYYSGIYRDVWLHKRNSLHITDPNAINRPAGGGIFVTYPLVTDSVAEIDSKINVINESPREKRFDIVQELIDRNGEVVVSNRQENQVLTAGEDCHYTQNIEVRDPQLWSPDSPNLYSLRTEIWKEGRIVDSVDTRIGIRSIFISKETGLLVNGHPIQIEGSNRHQNYPWIGNALSNNANKRDAILIKNAGLNSIRLAHYPQDPSFYEAADSLGILIINPVPGWQYFNDSTDFQENAFADIRQMIRRDRNHPSIFLWELSLNEAYPPSEFRCRQVEVGKSEWKSSDSSFYTSGDSNYEKACYDVPYDDWGGDAGDRDNYTYPNNPYLIREYGDFEFGGFASTTRQSRSDGEQALLQQAWNFQWEHNRNRQKYPRGIGDLTWSFFDGMPGYLEGLEGWGVIDLKRIPKFSYYFFRSQDRMAPPMVYIADYWNPPDAANTKKIIVYSNAEKVVLYLNGQRVAQQLPDVGPDTPYGDDLSKGGDPFDGGNANALKSPPFTFNHIPYKVGELRAVAYDKYGKEVAADKVITNGTPEKLVLEADNQGIPLKADGADAIFIRAKITDKRGNPVYTASNKVRFKIKGPATLISPSIMNAEAGVASILIQAGRKAGAIQMEAEAAGLSSGSLMIKSYK